MSCSVAPRGPQRSKRSRDNDDEPISDAQRSRDNDVRPISYGRWLAPGAKWGWSKSNLPNFYHLAPGPNGYGSCENQGQDCTCKCQLCEFLTTTTDIWLALAEKESLQRAFSSELRAHADGSNPKPMACNCYVFYNAGLVSAPK